jgi:hypothetical protein
LNFYWTKINVLDIIEVRKKFSTRIKINKYMFLFKKKTKGHLIDITINVEKNKKLRRFVVFL